MKLNLSIRAHDFDRRETVEELAESISKHKINSIQFAPGISFPDMLSEAGNMNPGMGNYIRKQFDNHNIDIAVLSCYINMIHPDLKIRQDVLNKFKSYLNVAQSFGADMVATETGCVDADIHYTEENFTDEAFDMVVDSVRELVDHAEKVGMTVAIEGGKNHPIHTPERMKELLDRIDSSNMQVILDVTNYLMPDSYNNQRDVINRSFELFGDRIYGVHLKDFVIKDNKIQPVTIGTGEMDFPYLLEKINNHKPFLNLIMEETKEKELISAVNYLLETSKTI